jgi:four helix bundle protein
MDEQKKNLMLNDIEAYKIAFKLSNIVWDIIINWVHFTKQTIGTQFVRAVDSISVNIAEGFGRYNKKDKIRFYRISYGSFQESLDWNLKAIERKRISEDQYDILFSELQKLPKDINSLISYTNMKLKF